MLWCFLLYKVSFDFCRFRQWVVHTLNKRLKYYLKYGNKIIRVRSNKRLEYGNARLIFDGSVLFNLLQPVVNKTCFDFCVKEWKEHGEVRIEKDGKMDL